MHSTILHNTDKWRLDSYGNGVAYLLTDKSNVTLDPATYELFLQGDDARIFGGKIIDLESMGWSYNQIFSYLWGSYKC